MISENEKLILNNREITNTFNDNFGSFVDNFALDHWATYTPSPNEGADDRIDNIIKRYGNHTRHQEH